MTDEPTFSFNIVSWAVMVWRLFMTELDLRLFMISSNNLAVLVSSRLLREEATYKENHYPKKQMVYYVAKIVSIHAVLELLNQRADLLTCEVVHIRCRV